VKQEESKFKRASESLGIRIGSEELEEFVAYQKELSRWNKKINLISKSSDSPHHIFRHILDSLLIFKAIQIPPKAKILDFGSGAGFPGIPIRILRNDILLTLLESKKKKAFFLEQIAKILKLKTTEVFCSRAEDLIDSTEFKGKYDIVTSKAMGKLMDVVPITFPFLKVGGLLVAYKRESSKREAGVLHEREDLRLQDELSFEIPEYNLTRKLIVVKKIQ